MSYKVTIESDDDGDFAITTRTGATLGLAIAGCIWDHSPRMANAKKYVALILEDILETGETAEDEDEDVLSLLSIARRINGTTPSSGRSA